MLEYIYLENETIENINFYANEGWRVEFVKSIDPEKMSAILVSGTDPIAVQTEQVILDLSQQRIENTTTGTTFILAETFTYGDVMITILLTIFLVLGITKFFLNFFIPKFMNFKR